MIAAPAPVVEHIAPSAAVSYTVPLAVYAVLAPVAELSLQRLRASAPVVEYIAPALAVVVVLRCVGELLEDHSPTQASFKTQSRNFGASLTVMHFVSKGYCVLCERAHSARVHGGLWLRAGGWDVLEGPALSAEMATVPSRA